jgi:hypothetical protein
MTVAFASSCSSRRAAPAARAARRRSARPPLGAGVGCKALAPPSTLASSSTAPTVQAKLEIGRTDDRFEQEADRVAAEVLRMPAAPVTTAPAVVPGAAPAVQRLCSECEEKLHRQAAENEEEEPLQAKVAGAGRPALTPQIASSIGTATTGGGQPLPAAVRSYFEPRFGHDFGPVRIHTGRDAAKSAQLLHAKAYTIGRHIVFGEGRYAPATDDGRSLLAHELTHTVQQADGRVLPAPELKEKGEDEDDESKIKRRPVISFSVVASGRAPPRGTEGKRQACPAPALAAQRHRELESTAAQIAGMDACTWGITTPDDLGISTETCREGPNWRLVVTRVNSVIRAHSRLLAGEAEPIPVVNTTAGNFCAQVTELDSLGVCPGGAWYMIRAVRAHEAVHVDEWRDNFTADWTPLETAIEGLRVPAAGATADRAAATAALRADPVFTNARDTSRGGGNFATFWGIADPNANTDAAETAVVTPRIGWICRHAGWQGWDPATCPVCVAHGLA